MSSSEPCIAHLIMQADLEWQTNNVNRADELLDACQPGFRNWEWEFLKHRGHVERLEFRAADERVRQVAFSPKGDQLISAGINEDAGAVRRWDATTGKELACMLFDAPVMAVAWSPDGASVAIGLDDGRVEVWDVHSSRLRFLPTHSQQERLLCCVPSRFKVISFVRRRWTSDLARREQWKRHAAACRTKPTPKLPCYSGL